MGALPHPPLYPYPQKNIWNNYAKNSGQFWSKKIIMSDASAQDCGNSMANALEMLVICKVINI